MSRTISLSTFLDKQRSDSTRKLYRKTLNRFFKDMKLTQKKFLSMEVENIEDIIKDFTDSLIDKDLSGQSVNSYFKAIKSFLKANRILITTKCEGISLAKRKLDYIPNQKEVKTLIESAKLVYKVFICLIAFGGIRPVDIRHMAYGNIKNSYETNEKVLTLLFKQSKTKEWYFTFLGVQGTNYLRELIEKRRNGYTKIITRDNKPVEIVISPETITDNTLIFSENGEQVLESTALNYMQRLIKRTIGVSPTNEPFRRFRTYGLRKYFKRWSRVLGNDVSEFLMGHSSGVKALSAVYSGLADLDQIVIDELKAKYIEHLPDLETEITDTTIKTELQELKDREIIKDQEIAELKTRLNGFETSSKREQLKTVLEDDELFELFAEKYEKRTMKKS